MASVMADKMVALMDYRLVVQTVVLKAVELEMHSDGCLAYSMAADLAGLLGCFGVLLTVVKMAAELAFVWVAMKAVSMVYWMTAKMAFE